MSCASGVETCDGVWVMPARNLEMLDDEIPNGVASDEAVIIR